MAPKKSLAWDHFMDKGESKAECKMCKVIISYKSGVSNLTKHVQRKHISVNLVRREQEVERQEVPAHASQGTQFTTSNTPLQTDATPSTIRSNRVIMPTISSFLRRDCQKIKKQIDDHLMNLFIWDLQPFSIVEDKGFREFIKFAFPNYTIPSRKYFANNLLPGWYEEVKTNTKAALIEDAKSICLTTDMWTSRNNDSYLAVTGHYIDKNYRLQSVLLECKVLESRHTGLNLAEELRNVAQEWNILDKVLLAVSDNGANIKSALAQLEWKHFGCYAHTLNLAVQKVLVSSYIRDLISKVKAIVSYFKRSNLAWNKLKKYQEQANKVVKRPIQDVATRWNSTFYMLHSYEWDICQSLIIVLQPCEEATREISGQRYLSGSSVIPLTIGLTSALNEIASSTYRQENKISVFPDEVEMCRQDLLSEISTRFSNLEQSRTYTVAMFLDPRYKLYFESENVADNTKKHIIGLVTTIINENERCQSSASTYDKPDNQEKKSNSLIWKHYNKQMQNVRPAGTAHSRAIIETQKYLDDAVLSPDMDPLEWWRMNQTIYLNLAKLAKIKLNAMASSVPCERLFSVAGNILTERRTRLGSRKVEQLLFLQQNKK
ncbi:unnamed protein product [Parnassius mnemosyne]|uniref:BED-type domain-containing protein n=1 Tax=Parnassius mnemosyne TaxID=213953 RepID=A0AAV1KMC1_9NEOP